MISPLRIVIIEDDPYARDMIAMLLARDWRTCVVLELSSRDPCELIISQLLITPVDLILFDVEMATDSLWPFHLIQEIKDKCGKSRILYLGNAISRESLKSLLDESFSGFLIKSEIRYALVHAVMEASLGRVVVTPGVTSLMAGGSSSKTYTIMSGQNLLDLFPFDRRQILRLGIIFNLSHHDLADELHYSLVWCSKVISDAYDQLGVQEIERGTLDIRDFLTHPRIHQIMDELIKGKSSSDLKKRKAGKENRALAFHIMTKPTIEK